ncbi:MAG TPA: hypothetical protein VK615_12470, partial [Candidatus Binatia bacterium]|nr:hypothetical protein [Candidatus Binatia bacterium]
MRGLADQHARRIANNFKQRVEILVEPAQRVRGVSEQFQVGLSGGNRHESGETDRLDGMVVFTDAANATFMGSTIEEFAHLVVG